MLDQILDYSIPVIHPIVVHFPVALGLVSLIFVLGWVVRNRLFWFLMTFWVAVLAWIGTLFALRTGEVMEEQSEGIAIVDQFVHLHESMGERASWALGIAIGWMIFAWWYTKNDISQSGTRLWIRLITAGMLLLAASLLALTGHIGGIMTWGVPA